MLLVRMLKAKSKIMSRLMSYLWPITNYVESGINGTLEITWINGKKVLDTKNTNYSYGSLQRVLKFGLSKIEISDASEILLLGMGGGSVIKTLREELNFKGKITAIEIDEVMIAVAEKEFNLMNDNVLDIIVDDAFVYVKNVIEEHGIVIVDLFIDKNVPEECYSLNFWKSLIPLIKMGGYIIFNAGLNNSEDIKVDVIMSEFNLVFDFQKFENVENTNTLLIGKKILPTLF